MQPCRAVPKGRVGNIVSVLLLGLDRGKSLGYSKEIQREKLSMVNARTPQGQPILGTGGEQKNYIMYIVLDRLPSRLAEILKLIKECNPMLVEFRLLQP